ncbi:uncharacterized protein [Clytia hemisphaerica]|uniref:Uncharacterized protein n=1 Tax=Clytia hemisphaerica TaxID=252671 RepID=A0A7M5WVZ3_9CNID|eukprot:TCONS_00011985-protein
MTQNFYSICENGQVFAGLNFSDTNEAQHFRQTLEKEVERRRQSIIVRKPNISGRAPPRPPSHPTQIAPPPPPHRSVRYTYRNGPNDPKIVLKDPRWFALFVHIGITQAQLDDEETFKELYAFVQTNGGIETARMKLPQNEYGKYNGLAPPPLRGFAGSSDHPFQASTNPVALTRNRCDRRTLRGPSTRNCEDTYDTGSLNTQTVPRKSSGDWRVKQLDSWTVEDVCDWLKDISLEEYCELFRFHAIDGVELLEQNEESLVDALKIEPFGHRRKIMRNLTKLLEKEKEEEKRTKEKEEETPDEFLCPITQELMTDPVIVADGYTYERASITQWFETGNNRSPMTNLPLENRNLVPNRSLKDAINRHLGQ